MFRPAEGTPMGTGNRELDAVLEQLEAERARLRVGDLRRLRYVNQLVNSGWGEVRGAGRVLGELLEELEVRAAGEEPPVEDGDG